METVACALCGSNEATPVVDVHNVLRPAPPGQTDHFTVARCRVCGLMFTNPRPDEREIADYYRGYSVHKVPAAPSTIRPVPRPQRPRSVLRRWLGDPGLPEIAEGSHVLEIGCATGAFMAAIADRGWQVKGIEPSAEAAAYARDVRGLDVLCGTVESVPLAAASFDMIYAWHVFEHLAHPTRTLRVIRDVLKPGGILCLSMPNAAAIERHLFGRYWAAWDVPVHYYHYTPVTISAILKKAGFEVTGIAQQRNVANILQSVGVLVKSVPGLASAGLYLRQFGEGVPYEDRVTTLLKPVAVGLAAIGQGGRMTVTARRPS
jgi:2-polyprenyl-3-methyl-5-hydroxy-6-metoxy-1,4-benzoquinol methylase